MREAVEGMESRDGDSVNTLIYPASNRSPDGWSLADLLPPQSDGVRALVVSAGQSVEDWLSSNQAVAERVKELVVVGVGDGARSAAVTHPGTATAPTPDPMPDEPVIEFVPEAGDLAGLGQTLTAHLSATPTDTSESSHTVLYLDSISALLDASETETVFRFLHTLTSLVTARGASAYYHLDTTQVDPETVSILSPLFDADLEG